MAVNRYTLTAMRKVKGNMSHSFVPCPRGKRRRKAREQERHEKGGRYKG